MTPRNGYPVVLVLGMHRSGTSAVARVLNLLGFEIGSEQLPAGRGSETGVWENAGIVNIHERVLQALGLRDWSDPAPLPEGWERDARMDPFRRELFQLLGESFAPQAPLVIKDPRLCRLAPLWWPVLTRLRRRVACVLTVRHPHEVARSLAARDQLSARQVHALYLRHMFEAETATRRKPRVVIPYDRLLANWRRNVVRMRAAFGSEFPNPPAEIASKIDGFLDRSLRHHRFRDSREWRAIAKDVPWIEAIHDGMLRLASRDDAAARRRVTTLRRNFNAASRLLVEAKWPASRAPPAGESPSPTAGEPVELVLVERWDHALLDIHGASGELIAGRTLEFDVVPRHSNFCSIELLAGTHQRANTCTLQIEVRDPLGEIIDQREISARLLDDNTWFRLRFRPQSDSYGRRYHVRIASSDGVSGNAVSLYCDADNHPIFRAYHGVLADASVRTNSEPRKARRSSRPSKSSAGSKGN